MDYKNINDYELVYQVRENDEVAYDTLLKKYSHLVDMLARMYYRYNKNIGIEYDDLYQEGMYGIMRALDDYDSKTLFYTYATLCARREMERLIKTHRRKKQMILNEAISFNEKLKSDDEFTLEDLIPSLYCLEDDYYNEDFRDRFTSFKYELDIDDASIFELRINGFKIDEISILLDIAYKNVDYRLHKIRKKLTQFLRI